MRQQWLLLKAEGSLTSSLEAGYAHIQELVEGERGIAWADQSTVGLSLEGVADGTEIGGYGELDINRLVEFPLLNCAPITRKYSFVH